VHVCATESLWVALCAPKIPHFRCGRCRTVWFCCCRVWVDCGCCRVCCGGARDLGAVRAKFPHFHCGHCRLLSSCWDFFGAHRVKIPHFRCGRCRTVLFVVSCLGRLCCVCCGARDLGAVRAKFPHFRCGHCRLLSCWDFWCSPCENSTLSLRPLPNRIVCGVVFGPIAAVAVLLSRVVRKFHTFVAAIAEPCCLYCCVFGIIICVCSARTCLVCVVVVYYLWCTCAGL